MPHPARGWVKRHTFTHKAPVTVVTATTDGFVTGDKDGVLQLWDSETGKLRETLLDGSNEQMRPVDLVRPSADGKRLNISSRDRGTIAQYILAGKDRGLYGPLFAGPRPRRAGRRHRGSSARAMEEGERVDGRVLIGREHLVLEYVRVLPSGKSATGGHQRRDRCHGRREGRGPPLVVELWAARGSTGRSI